MGMSWNKKFRIRDSGAESIAYFYSMARAHGQTADQLSENIVNATYNKYPDAPRWIRAYWDGVADTYRSLAYKNDLQYGGFVDGHWVSVHPESIFYYEKKGLTAKQYHERAVKKGYYWKEGIKPFFVPAAEEKCFSRNHDRHKRRGVEGQRGILNRR